MEMKKTCVSKAPRDGRADYFEERTKTVAVGIDKRYVKDKHERWVFTGDVWSNAQWHMTHRLDKDIKVKKVNKATGKKEIKVIKVRELVKRGTTFKEIDSRNRHKRIKGKVPKYSEALVCMNWQSICCGISPKDDPDRRINTSLRIFAFDKFLGVRIPGVIMGKDTHAKFYSPAQQLLDFYLKSRKSNPETRTFINTMAKEFNNGDRSHKPFVRALVYSNDLNWASVFDLLNNHSDYKKIVHAEFKQYIKNKTGIDLNGYTHTQYRTHQYTPPIP